MDSSSDPPRWALRFIWKAHKLAWHLSRGRLGSKVMGMPVLELITTGRRSGELRSILISYIETSEGPNIAGTNAGMDVDPAWVLNLKAEPRATMKRGGESTEVHARFLEDEEHAAAWQQFLESDDQYGSYEEKLTRPVPIVRLERARWRSSKD